MGEQKFKVFWWLCPRGSYKAYILDPLGAHNTLQRPSCNSTRLRRVKKLSLGPSSSISPTMNLVREKMIKQFPRKFFPPEIMSAFCRRFLLTNVYKRVFRIFFFQILSYLSKSKRTWFLHTHKTSFINNSRSKQKKKISNTLLQTLLSSKRMQSFSKKYQYYQITKLVRKMHFCINHAIHLLSRT